MRACIHGGETAITNLSSKVVLAAEFTITSTSLAMASAKSFSNPRLDPHTSPATGTSLLSMKA